MCSYQAYWKEMAYFNGYISRLKTITYGVPRGSILGAILLILYANDYLQSILVQKLYANGTVIFSKVVDKKDSWIEQMSCSKLKINSIMFQSTRKEYHVNHDIFICNEITAGFRMQITLKFLTHNDQPLWVYNKVNSM